MDPWNDDSTIHNQQKPRVHTKTNADCRLCSSSVISIFGRRIGEIAQKNSQPKYIWQLTNLNHFRCNFCSRCKSTAQQPRVPAVSDLCCICHSEPVVDVCSVFDPESQSTILFGRFIWLFCISMQLFLVAIKVPILYPTCKISVFSVATSFSVNYFCYENLSIIIIEEIMISSTNQVFINYLSTIVFDFLSPKLPLAACNNCLTMWQVLYPLCCFSEKYCLWARILFSCWEIPQLSIC